MAADFDVTVARRCRKCGSSIGRLEVAGGGGGHLFLPLTPEFEATVGEAFWDDEGEPRWSCRFLDAYACPACGACDLAPQDLATYLQCDGPHVPRSPLVCPACRSSCLGPIAVECLGVGEPPLAYLAPKYGAPLRGRLCGTCGLTWLSLGPQDSDARRELASRFPAEAGCGRCREGRLRVTRVDVPYSGFAGLYDPALHGRVSEGLLADLLVAVCDVCGEAETRAGWREKVLGTS